MLEIVFSVPCNMDHVWNTLTKQLREKKISHAFLLSSSDFAKRMAEWFLSKTPEDAVLWASNNHPDYFYLVPEGDSEMIKIDEVRKLIQDLSQTSQRSGYKVAIIEADKLNHASSNALLKTLEEPTPDTILILVHPAPERLLATVRSRCQHIRLPIEAREGASFDFFTPLDIFYQILEPLSLAEAWFKLETDHIMEWVLLYFQELLKTKLTGNAENEQSTYFSTEILLKLIDKATEFSKLLHQHKNLNVQLLLESITIDMKRGFKK